MLENNLTMAETERLGKLQTELAEAAKEIGNILMYGYAGFNPLVENSPNNRKLLQDELADVGAAVDLMLASDDFDGNQMHKRRLVKRTTQLRFMNYQSEVVYTPTDTQSTDPWDTEKQGLLAAMRAAGLVFMKGAEGRYTVQELPDAHGQVVVNGGLFAQVLIGKPDPTVNWEDVK